MGDTSMEYMIDLMVEADVLFVDDLGGEKVSS
jgi:DNA replication protein DnaC